MVVTYRSLDHDTEVLRNRPIQHGKSLLDGSRFVCSFSMNRSAPHGKLVHKVIDKQPDI